jgi:hypothetical protein
MSEFPFGNTAAAMLDGVVAIQPAGWLKTQVFSPFFASYILMTRRGAGKEVC